ncbi:DNA-methyltransferase [Treponema endosymbiont of Eucomonympha sp.]|uniref:DNA-methyltransferase n=1 Tax=Treponema endosymbiont of Eucomonympha sp. TaxID=1580831 RepID=UPI0007841B28|nr:site-specific DNA-methyltransferase [Treponema endosymbiont of Eucomonympha sp.]
MQINEYLVNKNMRPFLVCGDSLVILRGIPSNSIDMAITSPPYWGKREYDNGGIGQEQTFDDFIQNLLQIISEVKRVLKPTGSFWLNIGDTYRNKSLIGIPWRIALKMVDEQGWVLRNEVVWNKVKGGMDNSTDKLGNVHEPLFHFVKTQKYYYDVDAIRSAPHKSIVKNGAVVSATGVCGIRYKRQIELSTMLSDAEKKNAVNALECILQDVRNGVIADFRMIIRGQQRVTHSDSRKVSGRAKEMEEKGFYFLKYHPNGSKPRDVWDILPEDTQNRANHFAPFPEDLCKIPMLATCPSGGVVLDPFVGTGTSVAVAYNFNRKSIGIDISDEYIKITHARFYEQSLFEAVNE